MVRVDWSRRLIAALLLIFAAQAMGMDRARLDLIGGDEGGIAAEFCLVSKLDRDGAIPGTDWRPGQQLRTFIDNLKAGRPASALMVPNGKTLEDSLPVPKAFYTKQKDMRPRLALVWQDYVGLGVEYSQPNGQTVKWREDFRCGSGARGCLLDFDFAGTNEFLETLYYRLVGSSPRSAARTENAYEVTGQVDLGAPFPESTSSTCPLRLTFALRRMSGGFCTQCAEPPDFMTSEVKVDQTGDRLSDYLLQAFEQLRRGNGWAELAAEPDADKIPVVNVGITGGMSGVALPGYLTYLADWRQLRFLGYVRDAEQYFVVVEFQRAQDKQPRLEVLRLVRTDDGFEQEFDATPSIEQNLIYHSDFLLKVQDKFKPEK